MRRVSGTTLPTRAPRRFGSPWTGSSSRIDRDPETKQDGRSAFIRDAVLLYLEAKRRRDVDQRIRQAFSGGAPELLADVEGMLEGQAWPEK